MPPTSLPPTSLQSTLNLRLMIRLAEGDTNPYYRGEVSDDGLSVLARTLPVALPANPQQQPPITWWGALLNQRRCGFYSSGTGTANVIRQANNRESVVHTRPDPTAPENKWVPISMQNQRWNYIELYSTSIDDWYGLSNGPPNNISVTTSLYGANPNKRGYFNYQTLPTLLDVAVAPDGNFRVFLFSVAALNYGRNGYQVFSTHTNVDGRELRYRAEFYLTTNIGDSTRPRTGGAVVNNNGYGSIWVRDGEGRNVWRITRNFGANWDLLSDSLTRTSRWQTFVGDTLYSGLVHYYTGSGNSDVKHRYFMRTGQFEVIPAAEIPESNIVWASGAILKNAGQDEEFIAFTQAGITSPGGPLNLSSHLWNLTRKLSAGTSNDFFMLSLSANGTGIAALGQNGSAGWVLSNFGVAAAYLPTYPPPDGPRRMVLIRNPTVSSDFNMKNQRRASDKRKRMINNLNG
jgi:hypothetical protein